MVPKKGQEMTQLEHKLVDASVSPIATEPLTDRQVKEAIAADGRTIDRILEFGKNLCSRVSRDRRASVYRALAVCFSVAADKEEEKNSARSE